MHPHLGGEWGGQDGGHQEDLAVLRCHLPRERAGADREGQAAAIQPGSRGIPCGSPRNGGAVLALGSQGSRGQPQSEAPRWHAQGRSSQRQTARENASLHGRGASGGECSLLVWRETGPFSSRPPGLGVSSVNNERLPPPAPFLLLLQGVMQHVAQGRGGRRAWALRGSPARSPSGFCSAFCWDPGFWKRQDSTQ